MNLVFLTNILTPYRLSFFDQLYKNCKENGIDFYVLVMVGEKSDRPGWEYEKFQRKYTILLENKTILIRNIYFHFNKNLSKTLSKLSPDIVVCSGSYLQPSVIKTLKLKNKFNYKVYFWSESHLLEKRNYKKFILKLRENIRVKILQKFDGFLYAGKYSKEFIDKYKSKNANLFLLYNSIENDVFYSKNQLFRPNKNDLRDKYNISNEKYVFFSPIRLEPEKGFDIFLKSIKDLDDEIKEKIIFVIAGNGSLKDKLVILAKKFNINIYFLGQCNQNSIIELYAISDCFLLPSISDCNPLTVIEALWSGLPLLISKHVGNGPETVKVGINGYIFDYNHPKGIINYIIKLVNSSSSWNNMARLESIKIAQEKYNKDNICNDLIKYFMEIYNNV